MFKKLLSAVLIAAICMSFAGCGKNSEDSMETITWYYPGSAQSDLSRISDEVNKITMEEINAKIDMQIIDTSAYSEKMKMNMSSGVDFDICFTGFVNNYSDAVTNGGLMDITKIVKSTGLYDIIPEYAWKAVTVDGKIYAVPNVQIMAMASALSIRKDIADKYNLDISSIKSVDDLEPFLEQVKNGEKDLYPYRPNYGVIPWYTAKYEEITSGIAFEKGADSADGLVYIQDTPEYKHGAQQLWNWYQKGYIRKDALSIGDDSADYNAGKYVVSGEVYKPGVEAALEAKMGIPYYVVPLEEPYMTRSRATSTMAAIGVNSKHAEKAVEFIKLLNTNSKLYNLISFGMEGIDYTKEADGRVTLKSDSGYNNLGDSWKFGNTSNSLVLSSQDPDVWEQTTKVNEESEKSPLLGFVLDKNSNIKVQISNVATLTSEYQVVNRGVKDPSTYMDEYRRKMKEAGIEEIYKETKNQLKAYFKKK